MTLGVFPFSTQFELHEAAALLADDGARIMQYYANYTDRPPQLARLTNWTWEGGSVLESRGRVADLYPEIPVFSRHPYRLGGEENRYKDEIHREPLGITEDPFPVTTVSKAYSLIQHRDLLSSVYRALKMIGIDISAVESTLLLSEYGERMQWSCDVPNFDFDPGDRNPLVLRINCLNSVDTTTALEITFSWYRLICSNGMMYGIKESRLRKRHIRSLDPGDIAAYLKEELRQVDEEKSLYTEWYKASVQTTELIPWVDEEVAQEWGPHAAARVWHIANRGVDGEIEQVKNHKPHELQMAVLSEVKVPGSCAPVSNLFHVSQALSWIAGTRQTIPERLEYIRAIPGLMDPRRLRLSRRGEQTGRCP